ncbi:DUF2461 domain-containing protein [Segetibacter sp. 3557_3]|uniref:DUF2461 domain-containing protein n=1 Tax=Segetibacter sp. 3557_3 TaxID=2547429 RepID=UPI001058FBF2|nr:DUF2461 domain-containing protein [Segetibacter sp. 3557_3]TDH25139.1 DUF2461 domain-containing protein [Segetibacter sp. 3557_3]
MLKVETLRFLEALKENNNKPWFESNRNKFNAAKEDWELLVQQLLDNMAIVDEEVAGLTVKECVFRQYRDIRFSNDKTPYKHHMGASFDRGGKKSGFAGYYFHLEPGNNSMVGGGLWMPEAPALKKVRQEIDYSWDELQRIITDKKFITEYGDMQKGEYSLSREPKGYDKTNPAIDYIKLKSFVAIKPLRDDELTDKGLLKKVIAAFVALKPLIRFINRSLE